MFEFTARIMNNREIQFVGGGGGIDDRRSFRIEYCRVKTFCLCGWTEYFVFPFWNFRYSISFRLRLLLLLLFFFLFREEDEIFIVEFDTFFFFFISWFFPSSIRWDAICDGELRFRLMDRILREMYLKRGDRFFEILCDWIWKLGRG